MTKYILCPVTSCRNATSTAGLEVISGTKFTYNINKHLRPISLTPIISKIAESFVVENFVKPAVLKRLDQNQYGTIPNSSTVYALMIHE